MQDKVYCNGHLTGDELKELNRLIRSKDINLPLHRKAVDKSGRNYKWLQRNYHVKNPVISDRLAYLLNIQ